VKAWKDRAKAGMRKTCEAPRPLAMVTMGPGMPMEKAKPVAQFRRLLAPVSVGAEKPGSEGSGVEMS
jgi:hypothetical protein